MQRYSPQWYGIRAIFGVLFGICGAVVLIRTLLVPAPLSAKLIGIAFPILLLGLAVVRVREYLLARRKTA